MSNKPSLFATLLRSIYAFDGANGEFLADLTRPIPFASSEAKTGTLAVIPASRELAAL